MRVKSIEIFKAVIDQIRSYELSSAIVCLPMFFLGACIALGLGTLPNALYLVYVSALVLFFSLRFVVLRSLGVLVLGLAWASYHFNAFSEVQLPEHYEAKDFIATGHVSGLPVSASGGTRFKFKVDGVENPGLAMLINETIQLGCYRCPYVIEAGQRWRFTLRVKKRRGYASWGAYDYEKYLYRHQVIAKGYVRLKGDNQFLENSSNSIHWVRQLLFDELKRVAGDGVGASVLTALVIGEKSGFTNSQREVLQSTGVGHLMAISGLHVGLVFMGVTLLLKVLLWPLARLFERWPRQILILFPALCIAIGYAALAGFSVSTQRAIVMLSVYVLCKFLARETSLLKVLLMSVVLLVLIDPFSILDVGFWLSCTAVSVIVVASVGNAKLTLVQLQPRLWLGMLPLSVVFFGQVSIVSPLVNLVAVPIFCMILIPAALLSALALSCGLTSVGVWAVQTLSFIFDLCFQVLEWVSQLRLATIYVTQLSWWQWAIFLLLLVSFIFSVRGRLALSSIFLVSLFFNTASRLVDDELQVTLLDVGQGLAMVIETSNSVTVYDTGPRYPGGFSTAEAVLLPFLRYRGINRIDTLIISHADNDHIGGLDAVLNAFEVHNIVTSRTDKVPNATACKAGQSWRYDQTTFSMISPNAETPSGSNNRSCVVMLEHYDTKILISGDIEKEVERHLVRNSPLLLSADILLVPHQGSKSSSTGAFLDAVSPTLAMLAAGYKNHYGHPHRSVVERYDERGIELLSTIENGSVLLKVNSRRWRKVPYRQRHARFWRD